MTDYWNSGEPHCQIQVENRTNSISITGLGCIKFISPDAHRHNKASSYHHSLYASIYNKEDYLVDKELNTLGQ